MIASIAKPQCPVVGYEAADGPGFISLAPPIAPLCITEHCGMTTATASIHFDPGPYDIIVVAPFPVSAVWHLANCDTVLLVQCQPYAQYGDTMLFSVGNTGERICTLFADTLATIWTQTLPWVIPAPESRQYCPTMAVGVPEPSAGEESYMDIYTMKIVDKFPEVGGIYIVLDRETLLPNGRKVCIVE